MADTVTTKHSFVKPEVGASDDTWGDKLNADLDSIDSLLDVRSTTTEVLTGTAADRTVTPDALAALWEKGTDIAVAATIAVTEGGVINVTGTGTDVTAMTFTPSKDGRRVLVRFVTGLFDLVHSASFVMPSSVSIGVEAGDWGEFVRIGSVTYCAAYFRGNGRPLGVGYATPADVLLGTSDDDVVTPDALAGLWERGADLAAAATLSLGEGSVFVITGNTGITDIDFDVPRNGRSAWLRFTGTPPITHNATTLIIHGGANWTPAAGDIAFVFQLSSDNVCLIPFKVSGKSIVPSTAAEITSTASGDIGATTVQGAINEIAAEKAPLASPALTGTPTVPEAAAATDTTQIASTSFVTNLIVPLSLSVADDQVGTLATIDNSRLAFVIISGNNVPASCMFWADAAGTHELDIISQGASNAWEDGGNSDPAPAAGTDGKATLYIFNAAIKISNRRGSTQNWKAILIYAGSS